METKILYHTVDNRGNVDEIERLAPFKCTERAWLGEGYYFWDTFIELAHWWGKQGYKSNYCICKAEWNYNTQEVLDLVGNTEQIKDVREYTRLLCKEYKRSLTASFIIEHLRRKDVFRYKAIRVNPINSVNKDSRILKYRHLFVPNNEAYLDFCPPIQVCIIDKNILNLPLKVIYPAEYCEGYTI